MSNNFRPCLLRLLLLVGLATSWAVVAQVQISNDGSSSLEYQVTQLERISNAHSQLLTQLQQHLADNQRDIDSLRGQIQENRYKLSQIVERQKNIYQQMDSLSSQAPIDSNNHPQISVSTDGFQSTNPAGNIMNGELDDNIDYNEAVALVLEKKQYDQAVSAFQRFVKRYPNSTYQPNANYWLGQLNYNQGKKDDAAYYFAVVVKNYPKSSKAPDALLKVGVIMQEKGQNDKARTVYQQVGKLYPSNDAAKQAQKRLSDL